MPEIDTGELEFPPFATADDVGPKLGNSVKATVTSFHRILESTGNKAINIKIGNKEFTLSLNKTNTRTLVKQLGKNSDSWPKKVITLVRTEANNPKTNKIVPTIRIG